MWDDEDVLVGITDVKVRKVGGDGLIEDNGADNTEKTSNGKSKFTAHRAFGVGLDRRS